jgi:hypothetical protein
LCILSHFLFLDGFPGVLTFQNSARSSQPTPIFICSPSKSLNYNHGQLFASQGATDND